jgi:hypothetical protein
MSRIKQTRVIGRHVYEPPLMSPETAARAAAKRRVASSDRERKARQEAEEKERAARLEADEANVNAAVTRCLVRLGTPENALDKAHATVMAKCRRHMKAGGAATRFGVLQACQEVRHELGLDAGVPPTKSVTLSEATAAVLPPVRGDAGSFSARPAPGQEPNAASQVYADRARAEHERRRAADEAYKAALKKLGVTDPNLLRPVG